jgi:NAD(P)-dependent dehydrogenase (short-subunit alcohol dehydrogenase family)
VITTSSAGHKTGRLHFDDLTLGGRWRPFRAYGQSKLANVLFTAELARRLDGTGVTANCFHPGSVRTDFGTHLWLIRFGQRVTRRFAFTSPEHGAGRMVVLATGQAGATTTGRYWVRGRPATPSRRARDPEAAARLWAESERLLGL